MKMKANFFCAEFLPRNFCRSATLFEIPIWSMKLLIWMVRHCAGTGSWIDDFIIPVSLLQSRNAIHYHIISCILNKFWLFFYRKVRASGENLNINESFATKLEVWAPSLQKYVQVSEQSNLSLSLSLFQSSPLSLLSLLTMLDVQSCALYKLYHPPEIGYRSVQFLRENHLRAPLSC